MSTTNTEAKHEEPGTIYGCGHRSGTPRIINVQCYRYDLDLAKCVFTHVEQREDWRTWVGQCPDCYAAFVKREEERRAQERGCYDWIGSDACY